MMRRVLSGVERARSVSSMRRMNVPSCLRANAQLKRAVRAPPMCKKPVGLGAKRVTTFRLVISGDCNAIFILDGEMSADPVFLV